MRTNFGCQGWAMVRKLPTKRTWQQRYLKLNGCVLVVSKDEDLKQIHERLRITDSVRIAIRSQTYFGLFFPDGTTLDCSVETVDEVVEWYNAFKTAADDKYETCVDSFDIVRPIGSGFQSTVYLATTYDGESIALKVSKRASDAENEFSIIQKLDHPFIVPQKFNFMFKGDSYTGLELEKLDLFERMEGDVSARDQIIYLAEIVSAMAYIHSQNVVLRDLKPENILIGMDGHVKIADFGLAQDLTNEAEKKFCGTLQYCAPEVVDGDGAVAASDVWCFGVTAFELMFGYSPFAHSQKAATVKSIVNDEVPFPETASAEERELVGACLDKVAANRPTFEKLKELPYFAGVDWAALDEKKYETDFIPCEGKAIHESQIQTAIEQQM